MTDPQVQLQEENDSRCIHIYIYIYIYIYIHIYIYIYICVYMYIYTVIYIYTFEKYYLLLQLRYMYMCVHVCMYIGPGLDNCLTTLQRAACGCRYTSYALLFSCLFVVIKPENLYVASRLGLEVNPLRLYPLGPHSSSCGPSNGTSKYRDTLRAK